MNWEDVVTFWFKESSPKQWFSVDADFDAEIKERFLDTYNRAVAGETAEWRQCPEGRLAEIIVLDQFPRNMFRGTARAFESDERALSLAQEAVAAGDDTQLPIEKRHFLYMPYMHSESPEVHKTALELFKTIGGEALKYEIEHKNIIDRFGRYPHRNEILGRESTAEEIEFLKEHSGF